MYPLKNDREITLLSSEPCFRIFLVLCWKYVATSTDMTLSIFFSLVLPITRKLGKNTEFPAIRVYYKLASASIRSIFLYTNLRRVVFKTHLGQVQIGIYKAGLHEWGQTCLKVKRIKTNPPVQIALLQVTWVRQVQRNLPHSAQYIPHSTSVCINTCLIYKLI